VFARLLRKIFDRGCKSKYPEWLRRLTATAVQRDEYRKALAKIVETLLDSPRGTTVLVEVRVDDKDRWMEFYLDSEMQLRYKLTEVGEDNFESNDAGPRTYS